MSYVRVALFLFSAWPPPGNLMISLRGTIVECAVSDIVNVDFLEIRYMSIFLHHPEIVVVQVTKLEANKMMVWSQLYCRVSSTHTADVLALNRSRLTPV